MPIIAIYNPICGDGTAKVFFDDHVIPLLQTHGKTVDKLLATEYPGHAGKILVDFLESVEGDVTVVLGSGDGTLSEIINALSSTELGGFRAGTSLPRLHFALVPCGTANALYSSLFISPGQHDSHDATYKLQSVQSYIASLRTVPLTLAITTLSSYPSARKRPQVAVSSVVVSTALHASIVCDSEALRKEIPGIERFKIAAKNNSNKWYNSYVKLLPAPLAQAVQIYDPASKSFVDHPDSDEDDPIVDLDGPFAYFVSTVNVDRLESKFQITPLSRIVPPIEATCEIVILRPLRDPSISWDNPSTREAFVPKLWTIFSDAYNEGRHIDLRYGEKGEIVTGGDGPTVVEYIRCGGWEWAPDDIDQDAHLLCSDGAIFHIEKGGRAVCSAATPNKNAGFGVCA